MGMLVVVPLLTLLILDFVPNLSLDGITGTIHARQGSIGGFELTKKLSLQSVEKDTAGK